jgi:two-component system, sensor histidine kinase and response regulator
VDENQLLIILRNLLNNALKFTPAGGIISVVSEKKNNALYLKVRDTGLGMTKEKMEKIFSYPPPQKGTAGEIGLGIGLTLCKDLAELNGGKIEIKSKVEVGTEISLIFGGISPNDRLYQPEASKETTSNRH